MESVPEVSTFHRSQAHYLVLVTLLLTIGVTIPFLAMGKLNVLKTETET
ncbi:MAG: hypothetical protein U9O65_08970 [Thermotogota bacterium]|nr:hypothetical protein [Thermotogota bacterium]